MNIDGESFRVIFKEMLKFKTFCRFDCYSKLKAKHFTDHSHNQFITVYFPSAKNDQMHQGNIAVLDATGSDYCMVKLTRLYFRRFGLQFSNSQVQDENFINFIIRAVYRKETVGGQSIRKKNQVADGRRSLCRSSSTAASKKVLESVGYTEKYSEKGAKNTGVTAAYDAGLSVGQVRDMGRLKGDHSSEWYRKTSEEYKRNLSSNVNL